METMVGKTFTSVKSGETVKVVEVGEGFAKIEFEDGSTKDVSDSTLKRWYKPVAAQEAPATEGAPEEVAAEPQEEAAPAEEVPADTTPAADDNVPPIEPPKSDKKAKVDDRIKSVEATILDESAKAGVKLELDGRFILQEGKKIMAVFPDGIAVRPAVAEALGIAAEVKKYNHPFQAKLVMEAGLVTKVLNQINAK